MGLLSFLKSAFNNFFSLLGSAKQFDDAEVLSVLTNMPHSLAEQFGVSINELANEIHQVYCTANNKEFTIGIIGDYSVGKSSFVNAILGSRFLPVSVNPSTAIITKIKYGRDTRAIVKFSDGSEQQMSYEEYIRYSAFNINDFNERHTTGTISRFENVTEAELYVKSDFLKNNNLCIVDTLGLSAATADNKKTIDSIRDSVVVIYVCGERGLTINDKTFISDYLGRVITDSFLCINRIDLVNYEEREQLTHNVKLKLDAAISEIGANVEFPTERIYQVSSLYQEFANGFTDHKDWRKGIDYATHSGFMHIMNDLGQYIGDKAEQLRKKAITKQLEEASKRMETLQEVRKSETLIRIKAIESRIAEIKHEKLKCEEKRTYVYSLFEGLSQTIYSFFSNVYHDFAQEVNERWGNTVKLELLSATDFGVGDYLKLEKDVLAVKMSVFSSDKDALYAKLDVINRFVQPTMDFFQKVLGMIISQVSSRIEDTIKMFEIRHSYSGLCHEWTKMMSTDLIMPPAVIGYNPVLFNPMSRAAALAGIESTWIKNTTRKTVMYNAAKQEGIRLMEPLLREYLKSIFQNKIQHSISIIKINRTRELNNKISNLGAQIKELEASIFTLRIQLKAEETYFNKVSSILKESLEI